MLSNNRNPYQRLFTAGAVGKVNDLRIIITSDYKRIDHWNAASKKAGGELVGLNVALSYHKSEVSILLYKAIVRPPLEYRVSAWSLIQQGRRIP